MERNSEDVSKSSDMQVTQLAPSLPSYRSTPFAFVNSALDIVDALTGGRAGLCQRFFMFAFIGGFAALVNLAVFRLVYYVIGWPANHDLVRNVLASVLAAEISIMANFIPNDFFTFRHLSGHGRSWSARCSRFHVTSIGGSVLTFLIQFGLTHLLRVDAFLSQCVALILVLFYNFTFHHIFTYRHVKPATA
ncbi:MAG TPA: GtrA family protein [Ktedonosporobacter sp.]|nr:GtrA family protein [Ktedonosporobacter sp.]